MFSSDVRVTVPRTPLLLLMAALATAMGCVVGAPHGFSSGKHWTFPLVGPLEDGVLLTPVKINGNGPYLFLIDPDSPRSSVDNAIVSENQLYSGFGREQLDENDHSQQVRLAEVKTLEVGTLTVSKRQVRVHKVGTFWVGGRRVRGVLGRDVIADSLIFAIDRDRGIGHLATQGNFAAPADATVIKYRDFTCADCGRRGEATPGLESDIVTRRLVEARVNETHKVTVHLDLGGRTSMLWPAKLKAFKMPRLDVKATLTDELGSTRKVKFGSIAAKVKVGPLEASGLLILPFGDKRWREVDLDGTVGQNFLADYHVTVNWHKKRFWLAKRDREQAVALTKERMGRWGSVFAGCERPACVDIQMTGVSPPPAAPAPPAAPEAPAAPEGSGAPDQAGDAPGAAPQPPADDGATVPKPMPPRPEKFDLRITRAREAVDKTYEILFEAVDKDGKSLGLPRMTATLPAGVVTVIEPDFDHNYAHAAGFRVLDMSPFGRDCQRVGAGARCVWRAPVKR